MGAGMGPDFGNTPNSGHRSKNDVRLPSNTSQLSHIFSNRKGHMTDTKKNREKILKISNSKGNYIGTDKYGNEWYSQTQKDGTQIWVEIHGNTISDAGINSTPRKWDKETGLNSNPKKNNSWRKKK